MSAKEILGVICGIIAVFLIVLSLIQRVQRTKNPKEIESRLARIETNITWLIRIAGIQFAFLSSVAFTS